jgi:hypothetical protein
VLRLALLRQLFSVFQRNDVLRSWQGWLGKFLNLGNAFEESSVIIHGLPLSSPNLFWVAAQGDENALGASIAFDPTSATFLGGSVGARASGATLYLNSSGAVDGWLGIALALGPGAALPAGNSELVRPSFRASTDRF